MADFLSVAGASVSFTTGAASAAVALPTDGAGNTAKFVRIAAKGNIYCRPVLAAGTVSASNGILVSVGDALCLNTSGFTHLAHIQDAGAIVGCITPVDMA